MIQGCIFARAALVLMVTAGPALARRPLRVRAAQDPKAQAQFEFMMARRMESAGDTAGALAVARARAQARSGAAEIPAEIAGYYFRQNRPADAVAAAEQALKLDKDNVEAHNILGTVFSAWAEGGAPPAAGTDAGRRRATPRSNISPRFRTRR